MISIAAYFELSDKEENSVEELVDCLSSTKVNNRKQNVEQTRCFEAYREVFEEKDYIKGFFI